MYKYDIFGTQYKYNIKIIREIRKKISIWYTNKTKNNFIFTLWI